MRIGIHGCGIAAIIGLVSVVSCGSQDKGPVEPSPAPAARLVGRVLEAARSTPVAGAIVAAGSQHTTTGADGSFELSGLSVGTTRLWVSAPAFTEYEKELALQTGDNRADVYLNVKTFYQYRVDSDSFGVYIPAEVERLRGILVVVGGTGPPGRPIGGSLAMVRGSPIVPVEGILDSAQFVQWHSRLRKFADDQGFALVGERVTFDAINGSGLSLVRRATTPLPEIIPTHPELQHAPLLLYGHSAGGCRVLEFTNVEAARVIGFLAAKGGCLPEYDLAAARAVPGYLFLGAVDEENRLSNITAVFEKNRSLGANWALAVEPRAAHQFVADMNLVFAWMETVSDLRLPSNFTPGQPVLLRSIEAGTGWLGNRETFEIGAAACYKPQPPGAAWLPSEQAARNWQALVSGGTVFTEFRC